MFNSGDIIGRQACVLFLSPEVEKRFELMGGFESRGPIGKVIGLDERGVWFENPHYNMGDVDGETGKKTTERIAFLVPWPFILSIVTWPDWTSSEKPPPGFRK